jgi:hypothetical protein
MQSQLASGQSMPSPADLLLHEFDQLESTIQVLSNLSASPQYGLVSQRFALSPALESLMAPMQKRRTALAAYLDVVTRPLPPSASTSHGTQRPRRGFEYCGSISLGGKQCDIYLRLLRRLWNEFPNLREAMAAAMARNGITRCYVAKTQKELFPGRSEDWVEAHSKVIVEGWYADVTQDQKWRSKILRSAVIAAGLKWGIDVKVHWRPTMMPTRDESRQTTVQTETATRESPRDRKDLQTGTAASSSQLQVMA